MPPTRPPSPSCAGRRGRKIWLAASTHPGEEAIIAAAHGALEPRRPRLLTVIAPRHVERGEAIAGELRAAGWHVARRSQSEPFIAATDIYLADTLGELGFFYRLAKVVFVAGSYRWQGHNPIEPALLGAAVLSGPNLANFQDIFERMAAAAVTIAGEADLAATIDRLLADPGPAGARAEAFAEAEGLPGCWSAILRSRARDGSAPPGENSLREPEFWRRDGDPWPARLLSACGGPLWCGDVLRRWRHRPYRPPVPVVVAGGLTLGGSGKTPLALALAERLAARNPHFVTRGYGGRRKGPLQVDPSRHSAAEVGDEPLLLARQAPTWVARNRAAGARAAVDGGRAHHPG